MKMKKRILSCLLAVSMVAGLAIPAFATEEKTPPTLTVDEGSVTVVMKEKYKDDGNGIITDITDGEAAKNQKVTFTSTKGDVSDSTMVRFKVSATVGKLSDLQLFAEDTGNKYCDIAKIGYWGPDAGFPASILNSSSTLDVYILGTKAGTYNIKIELVNMDSNEDVLCSATASVIVKEPAISEVFTAKPTHETAKGSDVSGGNWYAPFTATAAPSKLTITSNLPAGKVVKASATAGSADKVLYDALDTVNGKDYGTAGKGDDATRRLGMSIAIPQDKDITQVSAKVKVGDDAEKAATIYAAKGDSDKAGVGPALTPANNGIADLDGNTHMVMYPLIATKTVGTGVDEWTLDEPAAYKWTYTFYDDTDAIVGTQVVDVVINYAAPTYTVTYENDGGSGTLPTQDPLTEGATLTVAGIGDLKKTDCTFQHWTDGTNVYKPGSTVKMPAKDLTLTAVWLTDNITKVDDVTISEGGDVAITGSANQNIVATIKDSPLTEGTTSTIKLPSAGTVTKIVVPKEALANAATSPITLTVADSNSKEQATWKFTAAPTADVDLMVNPRVKTMLNATGLDTASAALLVGAVDVINFSHGGALPTGTDIIVPTGLGNGKVYVYKLDGTNKPMLSSIIEGTVDASKLTFSPPHCSNWAAFAAPLAAPAAVQPPPNNTPSHNYSGGGSSSSDKTAELSANSPAGTEAIVDSSVTNIANPVLDVKAAAANAPEVAEFIKATTGFAVANVFQINMFDSTTVVKKVEGGKVEITLPFTAPDTSKQYVVLRYNDDKTITVIPATVADGKITFRTDHFSTYAIAVRSDNPNLFVNTAVNQPTIPSSPTTVPATGVALLDRLF